MTPKEKAKQIVNKMFNCDKSTPKESMAMLYPHAKQCALIAIEDIIDALEVNQWQNRNVIEYYTEVKHEIEKL